MSKTETGGAFPAWQDMSSAPKDRPILAWCDHEADPYHLETPDGKGRLTDYSAWADGLSHASDGFHVLEWGGGYHDTNAPEGPEEWMPDWWFVAGSAFELAANPTHWLPLPPAPGKGGDSDG